MEPEGLRVPRRRRRPADAPDTANPSLWRNAQINHLFGLFESWTASIRCAGYDMTNITFVRRRHVGWIVFRSADELQ